MTYITNTKLNGLGAIVGDCIGAVEFMKYRQDMSKNNISYSSADVNVPNRGSVKGWLFSNGEFWSMSGSPNISGKPSYCYLINTNELKPALPKNPVIPTPIIALPKDKEKPVTILPSRTEVANCNVGWDANSNVSAGQFNNFSIDCKTDSTKEAIKDHARPTPNTVSGLAEDLNNCFEQWEFDVFGAVPQNGNFVDSEGKLYTSAMRTDWGGTPLFYVGKTINNTLYFCPVTIQPQNGGTGLTPPPNSGNTNPSVTPYATTNPVDANPVTITDDEPCPVDCEEIEEEITLYLSEVASDVYEEITIQETKEVCDTPPDTKVIETDCDDIIEALKQKYPNIEMGSLMGLAGLMGCGRAKTYTIQGLASAGGENTGGNANLYTLLDAQIAELKTAIAQICPSKDIMGMNDSDLATAIGQAIPIDIITSLTKVEEYLKANMNVIAQNICKNAKPKTNTAMNAEMINGIPNWALYLAGASLLGYGAYKYTQNKPKSKRSK